MKTFIIINKTVSLCCETTHEIDMALARVAVGICEWMKGLELGDTLIHIIITLKLKCE